MCLGSTNDEAPEPLLPVAKKSAQLYAPGKYLVFTQSASDPALPYRPEEITIRPAAPPPLSPAMERIGRTRYAEQFPRGVAWNNAFPGMHAPDSTAGNLRLPLFHSGYLDWRLTLPWGDAHDVRLVPGEIRPYFNLHHVPITRDGYLLYGTRHRHRSIWQGCLFCTHSWGEDMDKEGTCRSVMETLERGQGAALFAQAQEGVRRELNPYRNSGSPSLPNTLLEEIVGPDAIGEVTATALTLHIRPKDFGYHLGFRVRIEMDADEIIARRNRHPFEGRLASLHKAPWHPDAMTDFLRANGGNFASTVEPVLLMACVNSFGTDFLHGVAEPLGVLAR